MAMAATTAAFSMAALNAALPSKTTRSTSVCARVATGVSLRRSSSVVVKPQVVTNAVGFQAFDGLRNENALQLRTGEFHCLLVWFGLWNWFRFVSVFLILSFFHI